MNEPESGPPPERPVDFNLHKVALEEIDTIVGNESHLGPEECANLRRIIFSALSERYTSP